MLQGALNSTKYLEPPAWPFFGPYCVYRLIQLMLLQGITLVATQVAPVSQKICNTNQLHVLWLCGSQHILLVPAWH